MFQVHAWDTIRANSRCRFVLFHCLFGHVRGERGWKSIVGRYLRWTLSIFLSMWSCWNLERRCNACWIKLTVLSEKGLCSYLWWWLCGCQMCRCYVFEISFKPLRTGGITFVCNGTEKLFPWYMLILGWNSIGMLIIKWVVQAPWWTT